MKYIKSLDSVRAIAVILVIVSHWIPKLNILPWGEIGVDIFFVLSGFLISQILFENKKDVDALAVSKGVVLKNFIVRRTLRIFPVYFLLIFIHYLLADYTKTTVDENIFYYLTYTSNILYFVTEKLDGIASHFWSLAVEEQFYLLWPGLILFVRSRYLIHVLFLFILLGTVFPFCIDNSQVEKLTPSCFNAFAIGALLAYLRINNVRFSSRFNEICDWVSLALLVSLVSQAFVKVPHYPFRLVVSLLTFWLIKYCLDRQGNRFIDFVLNQRTLQFIGKISYGVYLYHTIIPWFWKQLIDFMLLNGIDFHRIYFMVPGSLHNDLDVILKFLLLLFVSWSSWKLFEQPINSYKRYFEYRTQRSNVPVL